MQLETGSICVEVTVSKTQVTLGQGFTCYQHVGSGMHSVALSVEKRAMFVLSVVWTLYAYMQSQCCVKPVVLAGHLTQDG